MVAHFEDMPSISPYDLARCHAAIESVERRDKPIAEVPIAVSVGELGCLVDDLIRCTKQSETGEVRVHVDYRYGVALVAFYRYEWCWAALEFVKRGGCPPLALHWIQGLLFGYNPEAIDRFMRTARCSEPEPTSRPFCNSGMVGTSRLC